MTSTLKLAIALSSGIHAGFFFGWPTTTSVEFDVERAPTNLEILLVAHREKPTQLQPAVEAPAPKEQANAITETVSEPDPVPQTITVPESRGALSEILPGYLRNPPPVYPLLARQQGEEGTVLLAIYVLPTGHCGQIRVSSSSGFALLDHAAIEAVKHWKFKAARRAGKAVAVWVEIPIRFQLVEEGEF
ncbi:MAG: energy transducer TonB [Candidatus Omnitrophica bacterium]|nr:energy transducer TonB [Candidatus Omnitrophota bacterium]